MFPNKPIVMNPEAFRYFHVFRWWLDPMLVPKMETIFYTPSCYSKLDPSAIQVFQNISRRWMHLYALILKPSKETQPFKYVIAQFRSNMELTLQTRM